MNKLFTNIILNADSYKYSHFKQYPPGTEYISSYIESRGGAWDRTVFFGLQMFLKEYMLSPITEADVIEAKEFLAPHGVPFNTEGWLYIVSKHNGYLPVRIEAVPEGTVVDTHNVLLQIVNTDPMVPWITNFVETALLRAIWYPTTVATLSYHCRKAILESLERTSDTPAEQIDFKLHDFGARGVSSMESAAIGGVAHLVNFKGTDTVSGLVAAKVYYNCDMAGFSIPAAEHSTITSWGGPNNEVEAFENMLDQFARPGALVAVVSDSYDIFRAAAELWGERLKDKLIASGATLVVRPDSGDPLTVPLQVVELLMEKFGYTVNRKGYKVLPACVRVIQGDGINENSIGQILANFEAAGVSTENIAFGMGGGLLQQVNRDTLKFAAKCSAAYVNGQWRDVYKDPVTDKGKQSKRGRLGLVYECGVGSCGFRTVPVELAGVRNALRDVYKDGKLLVDDTLDNIRLRAQGKL